MAAMRIRVPGAASLGEGETRVFSFPSAYGDLEGFVIRYRGALRAYENRCMHLPVPLDYGDGDFFYPAADRIVCKTHGAMYDPATGECDDGPCMGKFLVRFDVETEGGDAWVDVPGDGAGAPAAG
jgi:nitrite reductase/ring-hydroxylating ferredoxin subunit